MSPLKRELKGFVARVLERKSFHTEDMNSYRNIFRKRETLIYRAISGKV